FLNFLAGGDAHDLDGIADHVGGALLSFRSSRHLDKTIPHCRRADCRSLSPDRAQTHRRVLAPRHPVHPAEIGFRRHHMERVHLCPAPGRAEYSRIRLGPPLKPPMLSAKHIGITGLGPNGNLVFRDFKLRHYPRISRVANAAVYAYDTTGSVA